MAPVATSASTLTEDLGLHHDYATLLVHAGSEDADGLLAARAHAAQHAIEAHVFAQGHRLLAGDPAAVADLWVAWWRLWRG